MIENRPEVLSKIITPFHPKKVTVGSSIRNLEGEFVTASFGMTEKGYDIRLKHPVTLVAGYTCFGLAFEHLRLPTNLQAECKNKSTSLRLGFRVEGTADPGWHGHLTIEFYYAPPVREIDGRLVMGPPQLVLPAGWPCAALQFTQLAIDGDYGDGKYQGATDIQEAR